MRTKPWMVILVVAATACGGSSDSNSGGGGSGAGSTTRGTGGEGGQGGDGHGGTSSTGGGGQGGDPITSDPRWVVDVFYEETPAPFDSWANAVTDYGAKGNGTADDTSALQHGLDDISSGKIQVLYLPKGTYKIGQTLRITGSPANGGGSFGPGGAGLIGEDPANTTLKWAGGSGANMLVQDGGTGYRYERLTWDGSGTANIGVAQWWDDTKNTIYGGSTEHQDEVFRDLKIGIMGGRLGSKYGNLDSEGQVRRVRFVNVSYAGVDTGSFNALDWWIWDSSFENCGRGISNTYSVDDNGDTNGAGALYVYRSSFSGSTVADVDIGNSQWFSLHDNVSVGSQLFIHTAGIGDNPEPFIVENNRVVGGKAPTPIVFGAAGPFMLVDNQIASSGPPFALMSGPDDADVLALGNTVTSDIPAATGHQRIRAVDNHVVAVDKIPKTPLVIPATPAVTKHKVFEVPGGASATAIQALVDAAAASDDPFPIIHFGKGTWNLDASIEVPAHARVQIVGDGFQSLLNWPNGGTSGPLIHVAGPTRFSIREIRLTSANNKGVGVAVDHADQRGGRVQMVGSAIGPFQVSHLEHTQLSLQANPGCGVTTFDDVKAATSFGGAFDVLTLTGGSVFEMADTWYEGPAAATSYFNIADGTFTYLGGHFSPAAHGGTQTATPLLVDKSKATASWIGMQLDAVNVPAGTVIAITNELPETHAHFFGLTYSTPSGDGPYFSRTGSGGEVSFIMNRRFQTAYADAGDVSDDAVRATWAQARSLPFASKPYVVPAGASDITLYRVDMRQTAGFVVRGD